jgi:methionine-rich copper-binding protein CopC
MKFFRNIVSLPLLVFIMLAARTFPVSAQSEPKATFPIADSTVTSMIEFVRVEFNEPIDPGISGLEMRKGTQLWLAGVGVGFCDTTSCQLSLGELEPDRYTVAYDVLTSSGKVIKSQFSFSVGGVN